MYLFVLKTKTEKEVRECLLVFRNIFEQHGRCIKSIRTDGGGISETNCRMVERDRDPSRRNGHQYPRAKGCERANRTICERIRAILAETGVPKEFWTETAPPSQELQPNVSPQGNEAVLSSIPQEARHLSPCCNRHKKVRSYSEKEDQEIGSSQFGRTE